MQAVLRNATLHNERVIPMSIMTFASCGRSKPSVCTKALHFRKKSYLPISGTVRLWKPANFELYLIRTRFVGWSGNQPIRGAVFETGTPRIPAKVRNTVWKRHSWNVRPIVTFGWQGNSNMLMVKVLVLSSCSLLRPVALCVTSSYKISRNFLSLANSQGRNYAYHLSLQEWDVFHYHRKKKKLLTLLCRLQRPAFDQ